MFIATTARSILTFLLWILDILAFRKGMWEHVASRKHKPLKVFPFGQNANEVMLYGTVGYGLKSGKNSEIDWAARAHLVEDEGNMKMDFYQVYLVGVFALTCTRAKLTKDGRILRRKMPINRSIE